jgi:cyclophilin family peptidyl-prolyl cis-trans isomerase
LNLNTPNLETKAAAGDTESSDGMETPEGLVNQVKVTAGPFDLHRKYRSMEGPYVNESFRVSDLLATKQVFVKESKVKFVESGNQPSMTGSTKSDGKLSDSVIHSNAPKELIWAKGLKLIVLDENDKPLPTAEFICHFNVDVDPRNTIFPNVQTGSARLYTLTQGQTDFRFPEGYGVPLSSNEFLHITFQAANRTTSEHRRVKHLCTLDFIKDSDLTKPLKPLSWYTPYVAVVLDKNTQADESSEHGPSCMVMSSGENAPNAVAGSIVSDSKDRKTTGHWKVPPGVHPYTSPIAEERDYGFSSEDRIVHAVWTHVHPLCKKVSLVVCDGQKKTPAWSVDIKTKTDHGLELEKIGDLYFKEGVLLPKGKHFEIDSVYDNTTKTVHDSMVSQGIFYEENNFVKPNWDKEPQVAANSAGISPEDYNGTDRYSLFDASADGPLLTQPKELELTTSVGKVHMLLDPTFAPQHATQMYKLFKAGAFDDTSVIAYQPNYIFQVGSTDIKHDKDTPSSSKVNSLLRRLPLETQAHEQHKGLNEKWALTMARSHAEDSAVSSFSILLDNAPHLDHRYTVFGRLIPDAMTVATMKKMVTTWDKSHHPYIISAKDVHTGGSGDSKDVSTLASAIDSLSGDKKPLQVCTDLYCGIKPTKAVVKAKTMIDETYPLFNKKSDGPLLSSVKTVEMKTSAGNMHLVLDPAMAPINATQMYKLFKAGAFDGTSIVRYEPNFVLQTALAETKEDRTETLSTHVKSILRRLPLEIDSQKSGKTLHKKWVLSMAHGDDPNSAVTSFSILLGSAPHLDKKFTIFGHALNDPETSKTLEKIESEWTKKQPYILSVKDEHPSIASTQR